MPLARVGELLEAEPDEFAAALDEIDARLEQQIAEIEDIRRRIGQLLDGERIGLPPEVVELLERMRELGLSERNIELERQGWLVIAAHSPDEIPSLTALKLASLDEPEVLELYRAFDQAAAWEPDDPDSKMSPTCSPAFSTEARRPRTSRRSKPSSTRR